MTSRARRNAERQRAYRDRKRGGPPRRPKPCGTVQAAWRHQYNGEPLDAACQDALDKYQADAKRASRARSAGS